MAPSPPTRRTTGTPASKPPSQSSTMSPTAPSPTSIPSNTTTTSLHALLPILPETLLLSLYPILLILGSLTTNLSPSTRNLPYNPTTQSYPPAHAPNYFALKSNIFNAWFVKLGWGWVGVGFGVWLLGGGGTGEGGAEREVRGAMGTGEVEEPWYLLTPHKLRALARWLLLTAWWTFVTQWFFGAALIDRGFKITGGVCALADKLAEEGGGKREFVTSKACKAVGGEWRGGHDISGHVFLLVLGSAFLVMEMMPVVLRGWGLVTREERRVVWRDGGVGRLDEREGEGETKGRGMGRWRLGIPMAVVGLSWWMLLMTAAYFHTWFEKFTGLMTAMVGVFVVYYLPRIAPGMRDIVGMPGV